MGIRITEILGTRILVVTRCRTIWQVLPHGHIVDIRIPEGRRARVGLRVLAVAAAACHEGSSRESNSPGRWM
jgi:hypothetical protein